MNRYEFNEGSTLHKKYSNGCAPLNFNGEMYNELAASPKQKLTAASQPPIPSPFANPPSLVCDVTVAVTSRIPKTVRNNYKVPRLPSRLSASRIWNEQPSTAPLQIPLFPPHIVSNFQPDHTQGTGGHAHPAIYQLNTPAMSRSPPPAQQPPQELLDGEGSQKIPEKARGTTPPNCIDEDTDDKTPIVTPLGHEHVRHRGRNRFMRDTLLRYGYRVVRRTDRIPGGLTVHVQKLSSGTLHVVECLCNRQQRAQLFMSTLASNPSHPHLLRIEETFGNEEELFCVSEPIAILDTVWFARSQVSKDKQEDLVRAWMAQIISVHSYYFKRGFRRDSFSWDAVYLAEDLTVRLGGYRYVSPVDCNSHLPKRIYRSPECLRREECGTVIKDGENGGPTSLMKVWTWNIGATLLEVLLDKSVAGQDFVVPKARISKQKVLRHVRKNIPKIPEILRTSGLSEPACHFIESTLAPSPSIRWGLEETSTCEWISGANPRECEDWATRNKPWISGPYAGILIEHNTMTPITSSSLLTTQPQEPSISEHNLKIVERMIQAAEMIKDAISALEYTHSCLDRLDEKVDMVKSKTVAENQ